MNILGIARRTSQSVTSRRSKNDRQQTLGAASRSVIENLEGRVFLTAVADKIGTSEDTPIQISVLANDGTIAADYRTDFQGVTPKAGWSYKTNGDNSGRIAIGSNPGGYKTLLWNSQWNLYDGNGQPDFPDPGNYVTSFSSTGGHPGPGLGQGVNPEVYAIAAFTVTSAGNYSIADSFINRLHYGDGIQATERAGGRLQVYVGNSSTPLVDKVIPPRDAASGVTDADATLDFNVSLGTLAAGTSVYVAFGPNGNHQGDTFNWDYSIVRTDVAKSLASASATSTLGAAVTINGDGTIAYDPRISSSVQALAVGQRATDTFSYTLTDGSSATVTVNITGRGEGSAVADSGSTNEDTSTTLNLITNDVGAVVANYRSDFHLITPTQGWQYLFNPTTSAVGNPSQYKSMLNYSGPRYDSDGQDGLPDADGAYALFSSTGGHPGRGSQQAQNAQYAIAAFTVDSAGHYSISDSFFTPINPPGTAAGQTTGVDLRVYVGNSATPLLTKTVTGQTTTDFNVDLGQLAAGTRIYVAVGAGTTDFADEFAWNYNIRKLDLPVSAVSSSSGASVSINPNGTVNYTPAPNFFGVDTFTYKIGESANSTSGTVTMNVASVNDAPSFTVGANQIVTESNPAPVAHSVSGWATNISAGPANESGQQVAFTVTNNNNSLFSVQPAVAPDGTLSYTLATDKNGSATVSVYLKDNGGGTDTSGTQTFTITVNAVNDAPITQNDSATTDEDNAVNIAVLANDTAAPAAATDEASQTLIVSQLNGVAVSVGESVLTANGGTVTLNADYTVTYTPAADYNGADSFTYTAQDSGSPAASAGASGTVTINPVNDPPTASGQTVNLSEDGSANISLSGGDGDPEVTQSLTYEIVDGPLHGSLTGFNPSTGAVTYVPNGNYNGPDSFTFTVTDDSAAGAPANLTSTPATVTLNVAAVNDPPTASGDSYETAEDTILVVPAAGGILLNDGEIDGDLLTAVLDTDVSHGTLVLNPDGSFSYTPDADYNGSDSFSYHAKDNSGAGNDASNIVTVSLNVTSVNDAPTANDDVAVVDEDSTGNTISVLGNDTRGPATAVDESVQSLTVTSASALHGSVTINGNGTLTYTPDADYFGPDTITYDIVDNGQTNGDPDPKSDTGSVTVSVISVNDGPVANGDSDTVVEDGSMTTNVLGNDNAGPANEVQGLTVISVTQGANGTVTTNGTTTSYTPNADYFGTDSYTYTIEDNEGATTTATVSITVTSVNDAPVAVDDSDTVAEDGSVTTSVVGNDNAGPANEVQSLTVISVTQGAHGLVATNGTTASYTPNADFFGSDSYTYTIQDSSGATATATVNITVSSVNDAPVGSNDSDTVAEDGSVTTNVVGNDNGGPANEVQSLSVTAVTQGANGSVVNNGNGTVTYTPNANFFGSDSYAYTIQDSEGTTVTATVNVAISSVNDGPTAVNDSATTSQATPVTVSVLTNDSAGPADENQTLTVTAFTQGANGTVVYTANGQLTYTPNSSFSGSDSFSYTIKDSDGAASTATVNVIVTPSSNVTTIVDACQGGTALLITGTAGNDVIRVDPGATSSTLLVTFNGVTNSYTRPSGRIIVLAGTGNDDVQIAGAVTNSAWVYGEDGSDKLNVGNASAQGNLVIGGNGNDDINGGNSRDILIGGEGADKTVANADDDILVAGYTMKDSRTAANETFWCGVLQTWSSTAPTATFANRVAALKASGSLLSQVRDDGDVDMVDSLNGAAGNDWLIFASGEDKVNGQIEASSNVT